MKTPLLIPLLTLLALPFAVSAAPETLFNAGFEDLPAGKLPPDWSLFSRNATTVETVTSRAHSGKACLHLLDRSTTEACGLRSPSVPITAGEEYTVTAWCLVPPGEAFALYVEFRDGAGNRIEPEGLTKLYAEGSGQWERLQAVAAAPAGATALTLLPYCHSGGVTDSYFDDLTVTRGATLIERPILPPAKTKHPCGLYREADVQRARENLKRHQWARDLLDSYKSSARFWMDLPDDKLAEWIPEGTGWRMLFCPRCDAEEEYAWKQQPDLTIKCSRCGLVLPSAEYPETATETLTNTLGQKVQQTYYPGKDGRRYRISARLRYQRIGRLGSAGALGFCYALTGDKAYAKKAVQVLRRVATVYPGYVPHDWDRYYRDYSNLQSGKLSGWKLHDEGVFIQLGTCYDLIYNSGVLTDEDKTLIENGAFRECLRLLTATSPRGCCVNDGPYAMSCGALLGAMLGDHAAVRWAISPPDGFLGFIHKFFFRDGHWEDGSFSYEQMALGPLAGCPEILQGYSDPPEYREKDRFDNLDLLTDPILRKIYVAPLRALLPDRTGAPISDSCAGATYARRLAEVNYRWYPTDENRRLLAWIYGGSFDKGGEYELLRRDPAADLSGVEPLDPSAGSRVEPGLGWALLRAGTGPDAAAVYLKYGVYGSGHGHPDKLGLLYYDDRTELISDQGYLGARHEKTPWNHSTLAHNTVLIDGGAQAHKDGELLSFSRGELVQTARARGESVYPGAKRYERQVTLVDHGPGRRYVVDLFEVEGGSRHDFVIHGAGQDFTAPAGEWKQAGEPVATEAAGVKWTHDAQQAACDTEVTASWQEAGKQIRLWMAGAPGTQLLRCAAPGLRNRNNPWEKRDIQLLLVRRPGPRNAFVSVLQSGGESRAPLRVSRLDTPEGVVGLAVRGEGFSDLIVTNLGTDLSAEIKVGDLTFAGRQAFVSREGQKTRAFLTDGTRLGYLGVTATCPPRPHGKVVSVDQEHFRVTVEGEIDLRKPAGEQMLVAGKADGAYEIAACSPGEKKGQFVLALADQPLLNLKPGDEFAIPTRLGLTINESGRR